MCDGMYGGDVLGIMYKIFRCSLWCYLYEHIAWMEVLDWMWILLRRKWICMLNWYVLLTSYQDHCVWPWWMLWLSFIEIWCFQFHMLCLNFWSLILIMVWDWNLNWGFYNSMGVTLFDSEHLCLPLITKHVMSFCDWMWWFCLCKRKGMEEDWWIMSGCWSVDICAELNWVSIECHWLYISLYMSKCWAGLSAMLLLDLLACVNPAYEHTACMEVLARIVCIA